MKSKVTSIDRARRAKEEKNLEQIADRMLNMQEWEQQMLREKGWYTHAVPAEQYKDAPNLANYHTHGLSETMSHPDLQIVIPVDAKVAHSIFGQFIEQIKGGLTIQDGDELHLNPKYMCQFKTFRETGREVLRIILQDKGGKYPWDEDCAPGFDQQLTKFAEE